MTDKQLYDKLIVTIQNLKLANKQELIAYLKRTAPEEIKHINAGCDCHCYDCCTHI